MCIFIVWISILIYARIRYLVGQIQRKQEYESMGMVQTLKTIVEKKAKDKINKAYEKGKREYVIFTINWILFTNISIPKPYIRFLPIYYYVL